MGKVAVIASLSRNRKRPKMRMPAKYNDPNVQIRPRDPAAYVFGVAGIQRCEVTLLWVDSISGEKADRRLSEWLFGKRVQRN